MTRDTFEEILFEIKNERHPNYNRKICIVTNTVISCGRYSTGQQIFYIGCESIEIEDGYIKFYVNDTVVSASSYRGYAYIPYENIAFILDCKRKS